MDGSFLAIATILHRVPRGNGDSSGKRKASTPEPSDREFPLRDIPGWIRVAL